LEIGAEDSKDNKIIIIQFNLIQYFIIYVPSQQLQGQLQTRYSVDTGNELQESTGGKS
jgi:hypothetical protein